MTRMTRRAALCATASASLALSKVAREEHAVATIAEGLRPAAPSPIKL